MPYGVQHTQLDRYHPGRSPPPFVRQLQEFFVELAGCDCCWCRPLGSGCESYTPCSPFAASALIGKGSPVATIGLVPPWS